MNYLLIFQTFLTREKMDQFPLLLNEKLMNCIPKSWKYFPIKKTKLRWTIILLNTKKIKLWITFSFFSSFFFGNPGCPGQLTRTTTNPRTHWTPCKPSRQVRYRGDDRRARWDSNPGDKDKKTLSLLLGHKSRWFFSPF